MTRSVGTVLPTESSAPNPRYLPLLHTGIPLARLGPTAWLWCADVPAFPDGLPDLLDGQRLDGQGLRPLDVAFALDGTKGGFLRREEFLLHDLPIERVGVLRRARGPVRRGSANVPGQPLYADDLEAARSVCVRVDFERNLPEDRKRLARQSF